MSDTSNTPDLTTVGRAEFESAIAQYVALKDRNAKLEEGLTTANKEIASLQVAVNGKQLDLDDQRRRFEQELAAARVYAEQANTLKDEALSQRVAVETILFAIQALIKERQLPADAVDTRVPGPDAVAARNVDNVLHQLARSLTPN